MTRFATLACAALVVELAPVHADSKNDVVGFSPNHVFEQVLAGENVDVLSGNLNLEIPIGANFQVAENLDYQLKLYYNSKVWEHLCPKYLPVGEYCHGHFALPTTWGLGFNLWFGRIHRNEVQTYPNGFDEVVEPPDKSNVYRYQTPDGADHYFCAGSSCVGQNPAGVSTGFGSGITLDGSGIRVEGSAAAGWTVYPGDGTKILFNHYVGSSDRRLFGWYASRIETILTKTSGAQAGQPVGFIDIAYLNTGSTRLDSITDSTGRTIDFEWTQIAGQYTECKIKLPAMSGTADYVFKFAPAMFEDPIDLDRGGSPAPTTLAATVLTQIDYPHDSGPFLNYKFEYEDSGLTYPYGYLSKRILPTGASVAYDYGHYSAGDKRPFRVELRYKTLTLSSLLPGGGDYRWSYARFGDGVIRTRAELDAFRNVEVGGYRPSNPNVVYVLDPFDNMTEHRFEYTESLTSDTVPDSAWDDGMLVQTKLFAGPLADGSRLVQSTQYEYVHEGVFQYKSISQSDYCPDWINWQTQCLPPYQSIPVNSRRVRETTTVPGSGSIPGKIARVEYSDWPSIAGLTPVWSQLSESRRADVYDNDRLVRTTYTDLAPTKEWHGTHRYVETRNASGVATSRSERRYTLDRLDCEVRRATPSVPMASGPLDCDAALTTGDVKVRPTYDSTTGRRTATTVSGGDDGASLLTNEERDVAGNLLRSKFGSLTWFATDRTIHVGTGLVTSSLSPDGGQTSYTWDKLGRLTKVDPPGIETDTTIAYPNLKQTVVTRNGGTNRLIETTYTYDELGRNTEIRKSNATGWKDFQRMRYDVSGRMVRRSEWAAFVSYPEVADSALKWTDIDFTLTEDANGATGAADRYPDPLGRVHKITAPDGATTLTDYEGNDTIVSVPGIQGSNGILESKTRYRRDGLDRLISVSSPGTGADAFYRYDDQDRLTWVDLVDPVDPLRSQHREFTYDALGRLRLASNPENGMTSYLKYDARGNLLEYQDAMAFRFVNAFDVAGRLVNRSVRVGAATKQLEANIYDTLAGFNAGPSAGKLVERRSNSLTRHAAGAWMSTLVVSDRFHYGPTGTSSPVNCPVTGGGFAGLNGRVDWQQSDFTMLGTPFRTDFCQDVLGFDSALSYPATTEVPPTRVRAKLTYTNRNGYLFSVRDAGRGVDLVTATEYAPGGIPTRITRASGVIDTTELDVRNRPSRIRVLGQPVNPPVENVIWDSGAYSYDGAGNVTGIGVDSYRYDEMNRIVGATVTSGITSHALAYSYDAFGNMLSSGKSSVSGGGAPVTLLKTFDVDIHNNQLRQESRTNLAGTTQTTFTFDSIGNLAASVTEAGGRVYGFDPAGRLERVTDESAGVLGSYAYDASGNRVSNTANGVETYFLRDSGGRVLSEFRRLVGTIDPVGWNKDYVYAFGKAFTLIQNDIPTAPEAPWATNVTTTGLVLNWKPVNDPDLLGYGIERHWYPDPIAHPGLDMYEEAANLTVPAGTTSYTTAYPQTPGANTYAEYRVYALDTAANPSASSPVLKVRPNATAPPAITGLKYHPLNQAVRFVWNPVPQNDIWGYRIQRKGPYGDEWTLLTPSPIPGVEYVDSGLINGEGYVYLFNAVDTAGRIGAGFKTQNAIVPRDTIPPSPPTALTAQPSWDNPWHIVLNWIPPGDSDLAKLTDNFEVRAFKILRSTGPIADDGTATPPPYEYEITEREIPRSDNVPAVPNGTALPTYYYRVKARDFSGNWSALSVQASAKPLRPCAAITSLQGAFETNDNGTPASTVPNPPTYSWCQISEENDDIVSVRLSWQPPAGTTGVTVYRAELGSTEFQPITGELLAGGTSWRDASVQSAGYQYRVQPTISGVPAGECSASTMITVNERITPSVRNTTAEDSAADFPWDANKRSRWIKVRWSRVPRSGLAGYHVYRRAEIDSSEYNQSAGFDALPYGWERLTDAPVPPDQRFFVDWTARGLGGVWTYAVRAVDASGVESPVTRMAEMDVAENSALTHDQCLPNNYTLPDPLDVMSYRFLGGTAEHAQYELAAAIADRARINGFMRQGSSAGRPPTPFAWYQWIPKAAPWGGQSGTSGAAVDLGYGSAAATPTDLAGYRVELAGSAAGPWAAITPSLVAWWETEYVVQGLGVYAKIASNGTAEPYGRTKCVYFRVTAVDEEGNESDPAIAAPAQGISCPAGPTPPAPLNLRASILSQANGCVPLRGGPAPSTCTKLEWDPVPDETSRGGVFYQIYRLKTFGGNYFYRSQVQAATAGGSYVERGDEYAPNAIYDVSNPLSTNTHCPWFSQVGGDYDCINWGSLEGYFVTARFADGSGESPASNIVFWGITPPLEAQLQAPASMQPVVLVADGAAAQSTAMSSGGAELCLAIPPLMSRLDTPTSPSAGSTAAATSEFQLESGAMVTLGTNPDPPYIVLDLHHDHLGSERFVTGANRQVVSRHDYFPFGEEIQPTTDFSTHMFTGHERDRETGLDYMMARYYGSSLSRFLSNDSESGAPGSPQTWNGYSYTDNNPLRYVDPDGNDGWDVLGGIANGFGSSMSMGGGRKEAPNSDYALGQQMGDATAVVAGGLEMLAGSSGVAGGIVASATGAGAIVGVPLAIGGAGVAAHGVSATVTGTIHLMESATKPGSSGGPTAGKSFPEAVKKQSAAEATDASGQTHCQNCGVETGNGSGQVPGQTDHIQPASQGGNATPANAQHVCATCNQSAGARPQPKTTGADRVRSDRSR